MKREKMGLWAGLAVVLMVTAGCSNRSKKSTEACTDPPKGERVVSERTVISTPKRDDLDWCRACVVGPHGFMSCQRVVAESAGESRGSLMGKARDKACEDSGFKKEACPDDKVIAVSCKGDAPPKDKSAAGKAMLKALKTSGPLILKQDAKKPDSPPSAPTAKEGATDGKSPPSKEVPDKKKAPAAKGGTIPVV